jgi:hypothetical protein
MGDICRTRNKRGSNFSPPGREPAIQKVPKFGTRDPHMDFIRDRYGTIKVQCSANQPESACQFVYRGSLGAICRAQNNKTSIFSPPGRQSAIQKVPEYGIRNAHMLYKISCPYLKKVHVYYVLVVCRKTFISVGSTK